MSNGLTGDFEVAVEVSAAAVNRILATLHQRGLHSAVSPKFLHSITARVGEDPASSKFELLPGFITEALGYDLADALGPDGRKISEQSLSAAQNGILEIQKSVNQVIDTLSNGLGSSSSSQSSFPAPSMIALAQFPWLYVIRGWVKAQLSTLTITLPDDSTSQLKVHCRIRAHYTPDSGTVALPTPIHGEVQVTFEAKYHHTGPSGAHLEVKVTDDDKKILFVPAAGTGLTSTEAKLLARQIRRWIKTKLGPMNVDVPDGFPFRMFKKVGTGSSEAIALPFNLSGAKIPALADFPSLFLAPSDDFAIALKANYVNTQLEPTLNQMAQYTDHFTITTWVPAPPPWFYAEISATYNVALGKPSIAWHTGKITLTVNGTAKTNSPLPDYAFSIVQDFTLQLNQAIQKISLQAVGDPSISGNLPGVAEDKARQEIKEQVAAAVNQAQNTLNVLMGQISINQALKPFDPAAQAKYTTVEIQLGGVILRGDLRASDRPEVVAEFAETPGGTGWSAFKSWVPGGSAEKYTWSWIRPDPSSFLPWSGIEEQVNIVHDFVFRPQSISQPYGGRYRRPWNIKQVCLRVEGKQIGSTAGITTKFGGKICQVEQPEWLSVMPSWWDDVLLVPVWGPDPGPDTSLESVMVAHVNVRSDVAPPGEAATTSVVHFAVDVSGAVLPPLSEALVRSTHKHASIPVVVVLPEGALRQKRAYLEERLGRFSEGAHSPLVVTEDYEGSWTNAFKAPAGPSTCLISASGELDWRATGEVDVASLSSALDRFGSAARRRRARLVRPAMRVGDSAPELIEDPNALSLRRLQKQRVLLLFWKACSMPCILELLRLKRVHQGNGQFSILAIADGEGAARVDEIKRQHAINYPLIPDQHRKISKRYGIKCWPTIVSIRPGGIIDLVHCGSPGRGSNPANVPETSI